MKTILLALALFSFFQGFQCATFAGDLLLGYDSSSTIDEYTDTGVFVKHFTSGSGLFHPEGFRFGPNGNLYVCSINDGTVKEFNGQTGAFLGNFANGLNHPYDIAFDNSGTAYVTGYGLYQISAAGTITRTYVSSYPNSFAAQGITAQAGGGMLVSETFSGIIKSLDTTTGTQTDFSTGLTGPIGVISGADGRYYVANNGGGNIQVISSLGGAPTLFSTGATMSGPARLVFGDTSLFVTAYDDSKVFVFDSVSGGFERSFTPNGSGAGLVGIAVIPEPRIGAICFLGILGFTLFRRHVGNKMYYCWKS